MSVWSKNIPYPDLDPARFEVDLNKVLRGEGPEEYRDPKKFFTITYATKEVKDMIRVINKALTRGPGLVQALLSPFGGGKTHTLLIIYHAFSHPDVVPLEKSADDPHGFPRPAVKAKVVALDGRDAPAGGENPPRTLWGAIAEALGLYDIIKDYDVKMQVPEYNVLLRMLKASEPVIILLDELPQYLERAKAVVVGNTTLASLTLSFLHAFLDAVTSAKAVFIVSVPEEVYAETSADVEQLVRNAKGIITRVAEFRAPLTVEELVGILKKRIFRYIDEGWGELVVKRYADFYEERQAAFPTYAANSSYLERLRKCYPFHPSLIDILTERIVAIPGFQRTRGILRLMAAVVAAIKDDDRITGMIMPGDVDLSNDAVLNELLRREYGVYRAIVENDIARRDGSARAQRLLKNRPLAVRVATTVFLNSFTLSGKDIAEISPTAGEVALQVVRPGENPFEVHDTLKDLLSPEAGLFFIHEVEGRYFFTVFPNINRLIEQEQAKITDIEAEEQIRDMVKRKYAGRGKGLNLIFAWEAVPTDEPVLRLVILDIHEGAPEGKEPSRAREIWEKYGTVFRSNQNALIFAYPTPAGIKRLIALVKRRIAIERLLKRKEIIPVSLRGKEDKTLMKLVQEINREKLKAEKQRVDSEIELEIVRAYANFAYPTVDVEGRPHLRSVSFSDLVQRGMKIAEVALRALGPEEGEGKIAKKIIPSFILDKIIKPAWEKEAPIRIEDVKKRFFEDPSLPVPLKEDVIWRALREGVKQGLFDVEDEEEKKRFHKEDFTPQDRLKALIKPPMETRPAPPVPPTPTPTPTGISVVTPQPTPPPVPPKVESIRPEDLSINDKVVGLKAETIKQVHSLATSWGVLSSMLAPDKVSVYVSAQGERASFSIRLDKVSKTHQVFKLKTILDDINTLTNLSKVVFELSLEGTQPLSNAAFERLRHLDVSEIKVVRSNQKGS